MVRDGDQWAFTRMVPQVRGPLVHFALRLGASPGDAERIVYDALDSAEQAMRAGKYNPAKSKAKTPVLAYLTTFVRFAYLKFYRENPRTCPIITDRDDLYPSVGEPAAESNLEPLKEILKIAFGEMTDDDVRLLVRHIAERKDHATIAREFNISVDAARQRFHRAVVLCRQKAERLYQEARAKQASNEKPDQEEQQPR